MPRIPEATLEQLKREVSLKDLVEAKGVSLTPHGKDWIGLCPFHDDHDPSLVITPSKNLWHCLGACQEGGSVIDWVMKSEGVSFRHAVEILRNNPSSLVAGEITTAKQATARILSTPVEIDASDQEALRQIVEFYHKNLKSSPEALDYLKRRGLVHPELINRFRLGFSNRTLGLRLPNKNRQTGKELREKLQQIGVIRSTGHEHFSGSLVIPVIDEYSRVTEMYGRKISRIVTKDVPKHLYLPGPHKGVWNIQAFSRSREIILCESLIDAMTFWCHGFRNVTTSYGVEGFTPDLFEAFIKHGIQRVYIAYDRDEAGDRAAKALAKQLTQEGMTVSRINFPHNMDANEYACGVPEPEKALKKLIHCAEWMSGPTGTNEPDAGPPEIPAEIAEPKTPDHIPIEQKANEIIMTIGNRRYRIRGLAKNLSYDQMKVNILVSLDDIFHVDTFEMYSARQRAVFVNQAAKELNLKEEVVKRDLGKVLLKLEGIQEEQIKKNLEPRKKTITLTNDEKLEAMAFLKTPNLLDRILEEFRLCGVIGEETNKLVGYLATISRKLDNPLAVIIQSSSAAGKTALMEAILAFLPDEDKVKYSAVTGQSLFYMSESDLKHKVLAIVEEEGAEKASYALKLLQSEGELTIASTGKDPTSGRLTTHEYKVEGPVMILLTTTAIEIDEELLNRCIVLTVDENRDQTRAIHRQQREKETLAGLLATQDKARILRVHRNAHRLLQPILVANPFANDLTFIDDRTRTRRDHVKYLTLIRSIALLHQYQRPLKSVIHQGRKVQYIEVTLDDIATANRLAHEVLGRSLDELAPQSRRLLMNLEDMISARCQGLKMDRRDYRFTRREIRKYTGWSEFQVRTHLDRLVLLEYVLVHRGGRGQSFVYELLYDGKGKEGEAFLMNLLDVETLKKSGTEMKGDSQKDICTQKSSSIQTESSRGLFLEFEAGSSPQSGPIEPPSWGGENGVSISNGKAFEPLCVKTPENTYRENMREA